MPTVSTQGRKTVACICPNNKSAGKGIPFDNAHFALFLFDVNDNEVTKNDETGRLRNAKCGFRDQDQVISG
jgi:hypothetical protein